MKQTVVVAVVALVLAVGGIAVYTATLPTGTGTGTLTSTTQTPTSQASPSFSKYLGYIPTGYTVAAREPNAAVWPCPSGLNSTQCATFKTTCGNGVCDPNERCDTCPLDCGVTGSLVCDPFTGRAGAPATVCQVQAANPQAQH